MGRVISSSGKVPVEIQEEIASILNYELINGQSYEIKDSDKLIGRLGIFYPILIYLKHSETWTQIKEICAESPRAAVEIYADFLKSIFNLVNRFPDFKYKLYDELSDEMNQIFLDFEKILEESEKLWGREINFEDLHNVPDFSGILQKYEDILNNIDDLNYAEIKEIQSSVKETNSELEDLLNNSGGFSDAQEKKADDLKDSATELEKLLDSLKESERSKESEASSDINSDAKDGNNGDEDLSRESGEGSSGQEGSGGEDGAGESGERNNTNIKTSHFPGNLNEKNLKQKIIGNLKALMESQNSINQTSEIKNDIQKFNENSNSGLLLDKIFAGNEFDEITSMLNSIKPHLETIEFLSQLYPERGWDYSATELSRNYLNNIEKYSGLIEKNRELKEILKLIGRIELEYGIKKISVSPSGKSEMHSVTYSNDISRMLPIEASRLLHPTLKRKFYADFSEGKLLTYQLRGKYWADGKPKKRQNGPVVALVDTSGSMYGSPETIAKAVIIAVTKKMLKERRDVKVILFSGPRQTIEIELTSKKKMAKEFLNFISMSFTGGTDFNTALYAGLESLKMPDYEGADLLFITDGVSAISDKKLIASWNELKEERNARVFSMIVGNDNAGGLKDISDYTYFIQLGNEWNLKNSPSRMIKFIASADNPKEETNNYRKLH